MNPIFSKKEQNISLTEWADKVDSSRDVNNKIIPPTNSKNLLYSVGLGGAIFLTALGTMYMFQSPNTSELETNLNIQSSSPPNKSEMEHATNANKLNINTRTSQNFLSTIEEEYETDEQGNVYLNEYSVEEI